MTDNEIIKALECCLLSNKQQVEQCAECPMDETPCTVCQNLLAYHALDLINRQKAEIERLKDLIINNDEENLSYVAMAIKEERELIQIEHTRILEAEIERLENKLFDAKEGGSFYKANFMAKCEEINSVKSEAIKEFAERLKECSEFCNKVVFVDTIDNLVKEMVGEQK